jgi:hypothetical protein
MIEATLNPTQARWLLQTLGVEPSPDSPLRDPVSGAGEVPPGSTAEGKLVQELASKGLLMPDRRVNPFAAAALRWLASPERVWTLSLFGRGGAEVVHLAFREGSAVECRRSSEGLRLRFPLAEEEARGWVASKMAGGGHGA